MSDIVERLRLEASAQDNEWPGGLPMLREAAAEIERLREKVATLQASSGYEECITQVKIERLRAALRDVITISTRNSEATLMLIAIRKCAEHALAGEQEKEEA